MSKCACAKLVLPEQHLYQCEVMLLSRACQQISAGSQFQAAISQRQWRPGASAVKCAVITVYILKMMLFKWLHCGNTQNIAKPYEEM